LIDAHHHLWRYRAGGKQWLDGDPRLADLRRDFTGAELGALLSASGVERTVLVQSDDTLADTAVVLAEARAFPYVAGVVAWLPLEDPAATEAHLDRLAGEPLVKGFRHGLSVEPDPDWTLRPRVVESLRLVAERGYAWDAAVAVPRHIENVTRLAERVPGLKQVIDHLGKPAAVRRVWEPWATLMARAAELPSVFVKLSAFTNVAAFERASAVDMQPYVDHVLAHFGPRRLMIGSNWPMSNVGSPYGETMATATETLGRLDAVERGWVLSGTASSFYGL
jgi:L-fuconolactonase